MRVIAEKTLIKRSTKPQGFWLWPLFTLSNPGRLGMKNRNACPSEDIRLLLERIILARITSYHRDIRRLSGLGDNVERGCDNAQSSI